MRFCDFKTKSEDRKKSFKHDTKLVRHKKKKINKLEKIKYEILHEIKLKLQTQRWGSDLQDLQNL